MGLASYLYPTKMKSEVNGLVGPASQRPTIIRKLAL